MQDNGASFEFLDVDVGEVEAGAIAADPEFAGFRAAGEFVRRADNAVIYIDDTTIPFNCDACSVPPADEIGCDRWAGDKEASPDWFLLTGRVGAAIYVNQQTVFV